jgi:hypothetical protein
MQWESEKKCRVLNKIAYTYRSSLLKAGRNMFAHLTTGRQERREHEEREAARKLARLVREGQEYETLKERVSDLKELVTNNKDLDYKEPSSAIRGGGLCSLYAFLLGYIALTNTPLRLDTIIDILDGGIQHAIEEKTELSNFIVIGDIQEEFKQMRDRSINTTQYAHIYFKILAEALGVEICILNMASAENTVSRLGPHNEKTIYLSTNGAHFHLYLRDIPPPTPTSVNWWDIYYEMWLIPEHKKLKGNIPAPELGCHFPLNFKVDLNS